MNPSHPVYVVSKGRWETRLTADALEEMGVEYRMVVEAEEYPLYAENVAENRLLVLPQAYHDEYDPCTDEPHLSNGPGAARNFCWQHSIDEGAEAHWVLDDNIMGFGRLNRNLYVRATSGTIFKAAEDFVARYENVALSGLQYFLLTPFKTKVPPFVKNTRIYSCILIRNDIPYRWRGRYNEDTDLSLRALKDGWCTILFNAFLQEKAPTQTIAGGNTEDFYEREGTLKKSQIVARMHPDVAKVVWRFGRWHHYVDYRPFKRTALRRKADVDVPVGIDDYGMKIVERGS